MTDDITRGSIPLPDQQAEAFATRVAAGQKKTQVYRETHGDLAQDGDLVAVSVRSRAHRLSQRPAIAERIAYLKSERAQRVAGALPERWTGSALSEVAREATFALTAALRAAESDPNVPESARSAIRREAVRHAGRVHRAGAAKAALPETAGRSALQTLALALSRLRLCGCTLDRAELEAP